MPRYNAEDWVSRIKEACENSLSMAEASSKLPMNFKTFKKLAVELGVYTPNQAGKGKTKDKSATSFKTQDILDGKHPGYPSYSLKNRLLSENWKKHECENCKNSEWLGSPIPLELHHIDGNNSNNSLENLQLLCPNCHALTENWRGRNIGKEKNIVSDEEFVLALKESKNIRQALIKLGLAPKGGNYTRAKSLIAQHKISF